MKIVCTLSGGSDSAYASLVAKKMWPDAEFHSFFVDYGQPEVTRERLASHVVHDKLGFKPENWHDVRIESLYTFDRKQGDQHSLYVPVRNLVIAAMASAFAESIGAEMVVVGNKSFHKTLGDPLTYDGNREFYKALEAVVQMAQVSKTLITLEPTLSLGKEKLSRRDVYYALWSSGFEYDDTFSCWFGYDGKECQHCKNCIEKRSLYVDWIAGKR